MWPVTDRFLAALTASHAVATRAQAWRSGLYVAAVDTADATIDITSRNRVRRTLNLLAPETLYPDVGDLLDPFGADLRLWRGIDYVTDVELVPVFGGRVREVVDRQRFDGRIDVTAEDPMAAVNDARFEAPRAAPQGLGNLAAIRQLITEVHDDATFEVTSTSTASIPAGLMWDTDRGQAIDDLARAAGAEVFARPDGTWVIRPVPTLDDPAVWTLTDGEGGTVVADSRSVSRDGVYNVVVVVVERASGEQPLRVVVEDDDPTSPTYVGGAFGRVPRFYRSPLVTTEGQARTAGQSLLARSVGLTRTRQVTCVPNPALEAGDRVNIAVDGQTERHIVDSIRLPWAASGGAMTLTTRSVKPSPGDT